MHTLTIILALTALGQPKRPDPRQNGWYTDYAAGLAEAKKTGKPMLVVIRCDQCPECANIDAKTLRMDGMKPAAEQFVRVRLGRIAGLDLRLFAMDYDVTWYAFMLNSDETVYGRFGGQDATDPESRMTAKGLNFALERALEQHKNPPKPVKLQGSAIRAEGFKEAKKGNNCIHCHNVVQFQRAELKAEGKWNRDDSWVYPMPENIGLTLDLDVGNRVKSVAAKSASALVGIQPGDAIERIGDTRVSSFADASFALNKSPKIGELEIAWTRDNKTHTAKLKLAEGWRKTDMTWRPSMRDVLPTTSFSGAELSPEERTSLKIPDGQAAFKHDKFVHSSLKAAGMIANDIVLGFNGQRVQGKMNDLMSYVRRNHLSGEEITVNIVRDGKPMELKWTLK